MTAAREQNLEAWIGLFTRLGEAGPPRAADLAPFAAADVLFQDPFNTVRGHGAIVRLLAHTRDQVQGVRFEVLDRAWSDDAAYLKWRMTGRVKYLGHWQVTGMSEISFDAASRVAAHVDHWDSAGQLFARLPLVGGVVRWALRRAAG